ncbi:uncharacterized protein TRIADDRAFT_28438 [Trichoplax adhaerens]|uniref:RRM domain-containing protein n=1 Tax=Trichoplax adhaerens TaxID=10228 RepID=B3S2W8_TRIAD|nr:hypothetical protein TRIADDRAFT_28438 [Trichoplax adhaerens]EDV22693.1 hypothetical protein TRIADDRAFT_28438 [Trichoplax adhaerens]|eukprot:XP_002114559.1 hypothetical protein TRIADDRAFT_28438 [Trichoplax adhaerens]
MDLFYYRYIGNLDRQTTEQSIGELFAKFGAIKRCKLITEHGGNDPYGFVEYAEKNSAARALDAMNGYSFGSRAIKVNWATNSSMRKDTNHYHIFVGDLSPDIDTTLLRSAFNQFGHVSDARVVKDSATGKPRGYGFVSYQFKHEAENAMQSMNGAWLGGRNIRTNWATRKPGATTNRQNSDSSSTKSLNYDEIYLQTAVYNCTVYVGNLSAGTTEETLRRIFIPFGPIADIRVFPDKNYAFIRYMSHDHATNAIVVIHGTAVEGSQVKCSWGKEANDPILAQQVNLIKLIST